jgi:hypothetical protein
VEDREDDAALVILALRQGGYEVWLSGASSASTHHS